MKRFFLAAGAALLALFCTAGCSVSAGGSASSFAASAPAAPAASSRAAQTVSAAASENAAPFSEAELQSVAEHGTLQIGSGLCERIWVPATQKAQESAARQIASWLRQARPYTGKIPKTQISQYAFKANVAPAVLSVSAPGGYRFSVQAVFYFVRRQGAEVQERNVPDVLTLSANGKTAAIRCAPLYGFLQNGGWEPVFRLKYGG